MYVVFSSIWNSRHPYCVLCKSEELMYFFMPVVKHTSSGFSSVVDKFCSGQIKNKKPTKQKKRKTISSFFTVGLGDAGIIYVS